MKWENFVEKYGDLPVINTENLLVGKGEDDSVRVQISRWLKAGRLIQLRRGIYVFADQYRNAEIFEPLIAWILRNPSYISLEKALEYYDMIPEAVPVYSSVSPKRTGKFISQLGTFSYRHIKTELFWGYKSVTLNKQTGFMAHPEKALLDLAYLKHIKPSLGYFKELRLQNTKKLDMDKLYEYAQRFKKPKMLLLAKVIRKYFLHYKGKDRTL
ncbi:MAG: type IV toxin-antitoxin system AbiEi family antitoxin domain-containing protein [Acidobacteriota bacterium]